MASTTTKAAKKTAKKTAKQAEKRARKAGEQAQDRAAELAERAGVLAQERAGDLAERLRESDALSKAQSRGLELADLAKSRWHDADLDERAAALAELAKAKWHDADLDERAAALAKQVRESEAAKTASKKAKHLTDASLAAVGGYLSTGRAAEKLGIAKPRRVPAIVWILLGAVAGFAAAKLLGQSSAGDVRHDLTAAAERLAAKAPHPAGTVLADTIRTTLQGDPRTAELRQLNINVAEGTVFVRGSIPSGIDTDAVRSVIEGVPGVEEVDLQLSPAI
jgi:hypothetical protein